MKNQIVIKKNAIDDLERNTQWWADHHSTSQALHWYEFALNAMYSLDFLPESHSLADENNSFPYEIRNMLFGMGSRKSYRAIFTIQDDVVHVLAVRLQLKILFSLTTFQTSHGSRINALNSPLTQNRFRDTFHPHFAFFSTLFLLRTCSKDAACSHFILRVVVW